MSDEKKLNKEQAAAVTHPAGPLLVIAGAGTGKTTVITERVKWLIDQKLCQPSEVLCLTFTDKAALEMETRLDQLLPLGYTQMWISTFHSFCDRLLRDVALHIGLSPDYRLLTTTDSVAFIRQHFFDFSLDYFRPLGNPFKFIDSLLFHFSRLKDEDISADEYLKWAKSNHRRKKNSSDSDRLDSAQYLELAGLYADYEKLKTQEGVLDFSDLVAYALTLFRTRPNILRKYQQKFKFILVDEYQDTNYAQNRLVDMLSGDDRNLTVVSDDDQAIYRWRGAAVSNVIQFRQIYPDSTLITLTQNYRSTSNILDAAYRLIQGNNPDRLEIKEGIVKKLTSVRDLVGDPIEFLLFDRVESEADGVARTISDLLKSDPPVSPKDIAVLVRANAHAEPFVAALDRHGIPNQFLGPGRLFQQPEIKDLIAYLKVLHNLHDDAAFYRVLSMDTFNISPKDLALISLHARSHHLPLFAAAESENGASARPVTDLVNRHLGLVPAHSAFDILLQFIIDSGMKTRFLQPGTAREDIASKNMSKFLTQLKSLESHPAGGSLSAAVDWLDLSDQIGESPLAAQIDFTENDAVNLLTVHSAKGLEFPVVFLVNLTVGRFPSLHRRDSLPLPDALIKEILPQGDFHTQEERRLFYVGLTRARDRLFLTASQYYGEGKRLQKISPFVAEALGPGFVPAPPPHQPSLLDQPSVTSSPPITYHQSPIISISYSQIETFKDCPLHYRAKYILNIPSPPTAASSFGNTIHAVLKDYYERTTAGELVDIIKLLDAHWTPLGYKNKRHEQQYLTRGRSFLKALAGLPPDPDHTIVSLELPFRVPLDSARPLSITGKIDRVDKLSDGRLEIIDYKTSAKPLTPKQAQTDLQLSFYALAATLLPYPPFGLPLDQILLSLFYLDDQAKVTTTRTPAQLEKAKEEILSWVEQIATSDFRCSRSEICKICDYRILCDLAPDV